MRTPKRMVTLLGFFLVAGVAISHSAAMQCSAKAGEKVSLTTPEQYFGQFSSIAIGHGSTVTKVLY